VTDEFYTARQQLSNKVSRIGTLEEAYLRIYQLVVKQNQNTAEQEGYHNSTFVEAVFYT
jgi:hypothetical protein